MLMYISRVFDWAGRSEGSRKGSGFLGDGSVF